MKLLLNIGTIMVLTWSGKTNGMVATVQPTRMYVVYTIIMTVKLT